jgi:hypothetical protein
MGAWGESSNFAAVPAMLLAMRGAIGPAAVAALLVLAAACSGGSAARAPTLQPSVAPSPTPPPTPPEPPLVVRNIRPTRLSIPSLGIDSPVQESQLVPDTSKAPPGCPPRPEGNDTLTVPNSGIATPAEKLDGLDNKSWIFGHSRYLGAPQTFLRLQDINVGDELFIDGVVRETAEKVVHMRFVVAAVYLADTYSGEDLITASSPSDIPREPEVVLQTSVREDGQGKQWILDRQKVLAKAVNKVPGDVDDYCKYLLLFVIAKPG